MTTTPDLPPIPGLTDEQRDEVLRALTEFGAALQTIASAYAQALIPAFEALGRQWAVFQQQLQDVGLLDADGRPVRSAESAPVQPHSYLACPECLRPAHPDRSCHS